MTSEAHRRVVVEYHKAVMHKRIAFRSAEERREGAERMIKEAEQFKFLFRKLTSVSIVWVGVAVNAVGFKYVVPQGTPVFISRQNSLVSTSYHSYHS